MHVRSKILVGLLMGASATVLSVAGAGASTTATAHAGATQATAASIRPLDGVFNPIRNVGVGITGPGMCLQPVTPAVGAAVVQEPCLNPDAPIQAWQAVSIGGRTGFLNQASGDCLFAFIGAENGAPLGLNTCRVVSNEEFDTTLPVPNVVQIQSRIGFVDTGFCMDEPGGSTAAGAQTILFSCDSSLSQRWIVGFP